jgi:hypothetical protein
MKALWVDSGNDADWAKVSAHHMTHLYFDLFDSRVRAPYLGDVRGRGYGVGVYCVSNWSQFQGMNGAQMAQRVHEELKTVTGTPETSAAFPKVQFDIEQHDPIFVLDCLRRFRTLRPKQDVSWTLESYQGGWMSDQFVADVLSCRVRIVPQYYGGNMTPFAQDIAFKDLLDRGFPPNIITGFYDAAALPEYWDGFAFTQGRLP